MQEGKDLLFLKIFSNIKENMALEIRKNINKEKWDGFLVQFPEVNPFEQSFAWGDILLSENKEVEKLAIFEGDEQIAVALVVYEKMPFGLKYAFSPKGPVIGIKYQESSIKYGEILNKLSEYLKNKKCIFWRIEPNVILKSEIKNPKFFKVKDINPSNTLILNLEKTSDEIYASMHPKTRYNIGLSKKKDLNVEEKKDPEVFWNLMQKTGERDAFRLHHKKHYEEVLKSNLSSQVIISSGGKAVATGVFVRFGQIFTYLYGASDHNYRSFMAPYLVQDFGLNKAKNDGFKYYDFFGIAPVKKDKSGEWMYDNNHQYAGVTRFKLGFGGEYITTSGTYEVVLNKILYIVISLMKKIRKILNS